MPIIKKERTSDTQIVTPRILPNDDPLPPPLLTLDSEEPAPTEPAVLLGSTNFRYKN